MPEIGFTSRLYMPISQEYEEGMFFKLSWKFGTKRDSKNKKTGRSGTKRAVPDDERRSKKWQMSL